MKSKMANFLLNMGNNAFALQEFKGVQVEALKINDLEKYYNASVSIGSIFMNTKEFNLARPYLSEALSYFQKFVNLEMQGFITYSQAYIDYEEGNYKNCLNLVKEAFSLYLQIHSYRLVECATLYLNCLEKEKLYQQGINLLNNTELSELLGHTPAKINLEFKKATLPFLKFRNKPEILISEQEAIIKLTEQVSQEQKDRATLEMQAKYRIEETEKQNKQLIAKNNILDFRSKDLKWKYYLWVISSLIVIALGLYLVYRIYLRAIRHWEDLEIHKNHNVKLSEKVNREIDKGKIRDAIIDQQMVKIMSHQAEIQTIMDDHRGHISRRLMEIV